MLCIHCNIIDKYQYISGVDNTAVGLRRTGTSSKRDNKLKVKEKNEVNKLIKLVQTLDCKKPKSHDICIVLKYIQYEESKKEELISASDIMTNWINNRKFKVLQEYYKK